MTLVTELRLASVIATDRSHALEEDFLNRLGEKLVKEGANSFEAHILHGDPAHAIVDMAHEFPDALITLTTHGHSGVGRWIMGSVTDRVVRHSHSPVLVSPSAH